MSQKAIELILARQLASYLAIPVLLVDPHGNLVYYNEPAEAVLGRRFDETGEMPASEWATIFVPMDSEGTRVLPENLPLVVALTEHRPSHRKFWIWGLDGTKRHIDVTAVPLLGQADQLVGAMSLFWELKKGETNADESDPVGNEGVAGFSGA